jgi:hypothetical protein
MVSVIFRHSWRRLPAVVSPASQELRPKQRLQLLELIGRLPVEACRADRFNGGVTWRPSINVDSDVHEVCAHPRRPGVVMAAAAVGLYASRDGGVTWDLEEEGITHASYCSAGALAGDDVLVSAAADHFAAQGAIYRRALDGHNAMVAAGLPRWTDGIVDTGCITTSGSAVDIADKKGNLYVSADTGRVGGATPPPPVSEQSSPRLKADGRHRHRLGTVTVGASVLGRVQTASRRSRHPQWLVVPPTQGGYRSTQGLASARATRKPRPRTHRSFQSNG